MASKNQFQRNLQSDGVDEKFSQELADQNDLEAQSRAEAAHQRVNNKRK